MSSSIAFAFGRRTLLALGAAIVCACHAGCASASPNQIDLQVVDRDTGQVLQTYSRHGKVYVAGRPGARYGLRVSNRSAGRVLAVVSVDGVNIVTGETADVRQPGYVLAAGQSWDLNGWRKSNTEIAAFEFSSLGQSYAARTGRPANVGIIGMAVFEEKAEPPRPVPESPSISDWRRGSRWRSAGDGTAKLEPDSSAGTATEDRQGAPAAAPSIAASPNGEARMAELNKSSQYAAPQRDEKLGTAHGQRETSVAVDTEFKRATRSPAVVKTIEYDQYDNLVAMGVIELPRRPEAFPASPRQWGFVSDPPSR